MRGEIRRQGPALARQPPTDWLFEEVCSGSQSPYFWASVGGDLNTDRRSVTKSDVPRNGMHPSQDTLSSPSSEQARGLGGLEMRKLSCAVTSLGLCAACGGRTSGATTGTPSGSSSTGGTATGTGGMMAARGNRRRRRKAALARRGLRDPLNPNPSPWETKPWARLSPTPAHRDGFASVATISSDGNGKHFRIGIARLRLGPPWQPPRSDSFRRL